MRVRHSSLCMPAGHYVSDAYPIVYIKRAASTRGRLKSKGAVSLRISSDRDDRMGKNQNPKK